MAILHVIPKFVGYGADEYQASFWVDCTPNPTVADLPELNVEFTDWLQDMYDLVASRVKNIITAIEYAVYIVDLVTGDETFMGNGGWTFTGTDVGDGMAPQMAATVSMPVEGSNRPGQKRMLPMVESQQHQGILEAGTITALANFATEWQTGLVDTANFTLKSVLWSPTNKVSYDWVGPIYVREDLGTLQSRKRGIGV